MNVPVLGGEFPKVTCNPTSWACERLQLTAQQTNMPLKPFQFCSFVFSFTKVLKKDMTLQTLFSLFSTEYRFYWSPMHTTLAFRNPNLGRAAVPSYDCKFLLDNHCSWEGFGKQSADM